MKQISDFDLRILLWISNRYKNKLKTSLSEAQKDTVYILIEILKSVHLTVEIHQNLQRQINIQMTFKQSNNVPDSPALWCMHLYTKPPYFSERKICFVYWCIVTCFVQSCMHLYTKLHKKLASKLRKPLKYMIQVHCPLYCVKLVGKFRISTVACTYLRNGPILFRSKIRYTLDSWCMHHCLGNTGHVSGVGHRGPPPPLRSQKLDNSFNFVQILTRFLLSPPSEPLN